MSGWKAASPRPSRAMPARRAHHRAAARKPRRRRGAGYTIAHAGRQVRFGPVAFWIAVGSVVIMAGWSMTTATYFAFRDDVLKGLIARQAEQQFAYEDRIAELRAQIDRTTSRQLLDQEQFEQKLDDLMRRQATLESRAAALGGVADPTTTGSIRPAAADRQAGSPRPRARRSSPIVAPDDNRKEPARGPDIGARLSRIEASLDRVERRQDRGACPDAGALRRQSPQAAQRARRLGLKLDRPAPASGGPFVPVKLPGEDNGFERALTRVNIARAQAEQLSRTLVTVPVRKPVTGEIDISSAFGVRMDPFCMSPAMHTGIDFRGDVGDPIHATAAGTVTNAGWSGGYGKMVEIDHGNGLATRYGHLSQIDVNVGDKVRIGQVVGRLGSTGRSTGPHVHYETRIDGEAVDPQKFLNAGAKLEGTTSQ